ncbi:MAG: DNA repair protein RecO [Phycisphaeraceae bacterium]|nr:DNA repair protein RecO [Phycisphaeraceae bacterium]
MAPIRDQAICLRRWEFSETSQTVCLLTRTHGLLRGLARGARRERGRFCGGFDTLTRGEIVAYVKPARELANLTEWTLVDTARPLRERLSANRVGLYMADLVLHLVTDHDPHPALYDALDRALDALQTAGDEARALLGFQWAALEICGYRPVVDRDAVTGGLLPAAIAGVVFAPLAGGLTAAPGQAGWPLRAGTAALLRSLALGQEPPAAAEPDALQRANRLLAAYTREILGQELPALRWCFGPLRTTVRMTGGAAGPGSG